MACVMLTAITACSGTGSKNDAPADNAASSASEASSLASAEKGAGE